MEKSCLGKRLKSARKALGLTAEEVAERCFINATYLRQLECSRGMPSLNVFIALCNVLKVSPNYLLQDYLDNNELDSFSEFAQLWSNASPAQQQMVLSMLKAALASMPEN